MNGFVIDGCAHEAHRAVRNATLRRCEDAGSPSGAATAREGDIVAVEPAGRADRRYEDLMPLPGMTRDPADMALYAGQSVQLVHDVRPAAQSVRDSAAQAVAAAEQLGYATTASQIGRGSDERW